MMTHPRTQSAIDAALGHITEAATTAIDDTAKRLDSLVTDAATTCIQDRDAICSAQRDFRQQLPTFRRVFNDGLRDKVMREFTPRSESRRTLADTDWQSLSLVDDDAMEERMFADRMGQGISHACEWELRELASYTGTLLPAAQADKNPNPFRPEVVGAVLYSAIEAVSPERESRRLLARELSSAVAQSMRSCYSEIVRDLQSLGVQPTDLTVRGADDPGHTTSGYAAQLKDSQTGGMNTSGRAQLDTGSTTRAGADSTVPGSTGPARGRSTGSAWVRRPYGGDGTGDMSGEAGQLGVADAELMSVIRRLATAQVPAEGSADAELRSSSSFGAITGVGGNSAAGAMTDAGDLRGDGLTGMMAVNLIRAHREELRHASNGTIEHMVIDVVASLFDQILSDTRVPPQMARQIARLQLPVLRVALSDSSFFSSRKHPVRRFVNRLASLACAFEDFEEGPGRQFLDRVCELVQEIIDGDFDQVDVYADKLTELEVFVETQSVTDVQANGAATLLEGKESALLIQQRYMLQLKAALAQLVLPDYLRDFLSQVWSQALVLASQRDGPTADSVVRFRRTACELVMSIQPKGTPALRKAFLTKLPLLMKDLNEGLKLIGWPETAQKEFIAHLLPAHAESLKGSSQQSELDRNLLAKQLETAFSSPVPVAGQSPSFGVVSDLDDATMENQFSDEEARKIGLLAETAVDWDGKVDIDLSDDEPEPTGSDGLYTKHEQLDLGQGLDLNTNPAELVEASHGLELMDHLQVGFAYQMHLRDKWQKVRLSFVSRGRGFFVFTHGKRHQESVSMTSRMLVRMCETNRLQAYESKHLLERATARARAQLASIKASNLVH